MDGCASACRGAHSACGAHAHARAVLGRLQIIAALQLARRRRHRVAETRRLAHTVPFFSRSVTHFVCACLTAGVFFVLVRARSNNHIYGQIIDDSKDAVLAAASTMEKDVKETKGGNCEAATAVGKRLAERALAKGIKKVTFDRNGKPYHGRVAALADGAREGGLDF